jgi:hypothetical protein
MVPATPHKGGLGGSIPPSATFSRRMMVAFDQTGIFSFLHPTRAAISRLGNQNKRIPQRGVRLLYTTGSQPVDNLLKQFTLANS